MLGSAKFSSDINPYDLLNLKNGCSAKQVEKAYRKAALKWHPDKNPDRNEMATKMFLDISRAYEILSDAAAKEAYDKVITTKFAKSEYIRKRQETENAHRRRMREELERREASASRAKFELEQKRAYEKELERQRMKNSKLVEEENLRKAKCVHSGDKSSQAACGTLKIRWSKETNPNPYDERKLKSIFGKYGDVDAVVISGGKKGLAVIEFVAVRDVEGIEAETGLADSPLKTAWLSEKPCNIKSMRVESHQTDLQKNAFNVSLSQFMEFEQEVLSGLSPKKRKAEDE